MDHFEVNRCIEKINKKPVWLFTKDKTAEKLQCFDTIQRIGTPQSINSLISFLRSENVLIRAKAAETILCLFSKLGSLNDSVKAVKHLPINKHDLDHYRIDFDEKTYLQILVIASLNRSGYVRQKAVEELSRLKNADGLKFILYRLGDWVPAVRNSAMDAISNYLNPIFIYDLLKQQTIIDWLLKVERMDLREIHDRIMEFLVNQDFSDDFYANLKRSDDKTRLGFYKRFLASRTATKEEVNRIIADKYFLVRAELLTQLGKFDLVTQKVLVKIFLQDKSAAVRLRALYASKKFRHELETHIELLLSDEAASVRELSRYLIRDKGIDVAELYRQRIAGGKLLLGSLIGLSEMGNQGDLPTFELNIHSKNNKLVVASLIAIDKFDPVATKLHALDLVVHNSKRVRDKAADVLSKNVDSQTFERIRQIYSQSSYDIKRTMLRLYNRIGGLAIIGDLLLGLSDDAVDIQELAWKFLDNWKLKSTRLFTTPPQGEIDRAKQIFNNLDINGLKMTTKRKSLLQDLKFYLR